VSYDKICLEHQSEIW